MKRRAVMSSVAAAVFGVRRAAAQTDHPLAVQKVISYEVATPAEAEAVLQEMVASPGRITVSINGFSLSPNLAGNGYILLVLITAPV